MARVPVQLRNATPAERPQPPPAPRGPQTPPPPQGPPQRVRVGPLWWVLFALLMAWNVYSFFPRHKTQVALPYSEFITQLGQGNVASVHLVGDAIDGTLKHALRWPPTKPGAAVPAPAAPATRAAQPAHPPAAAAAPAQGTNATRTNTHPAAREARATPKQAAAPAPMEYSNFRTTYPSQIGDPTLMPTLRAQHVTLEVSEPSTPWFAFLLTDGMPILLMFGLLFWMGRQASRNQNGIFGFARTRARRYTEDRPKLTFNDVAGADEAKTDLAEVVDFLRHPAKYLAIGARIPRGVLLVGPPGTGKTLLARAVAGEAGAPFFHISGSEFVEMFVGVGASRVRDLFAQAKATQPAIVFVDELDAVGRRRGAGLGATNDEREQTLNQLLVEMDGFDERQQVILLAATNRPDVLDPALLRPGRFDRQVVVPFPDWRGRLGILRIHTRHLHLAQDVDLERLARTATGLSGADLANLCNEAALGAARVDRTEILMADFEQAWEKIVLGAERSTVLNDRDRRVVAYHEGGHALVAWLTPAADPVRKVSIVPHGRALGITAQLPDEDRYNMSRTELMARLDVMLGGRGSEAVVIGDITTGAENDLVEATRLARRMITRWGMGQLGPAAFDYHDEQPFLGYQLSQGRDYSEATAARIDEEIEHLLEERQDVVHALLMNAREQLDRLAEALLKEESIGETELRELLGPRPEAASPAPARTAVRARAAPKSTPAAPT
ncbi:MAG TPA: ATP-dependent zinc metalloprotease FtsH [Steroidobacteraceae bacterium]|nr:ATP-dependent zinc metalloprotease FtsH [Steroidobacteraceae bacterium]